MSSVTQVVSLSIGKTIVSIRGHKLRKNGTGCEHDTKEHHIHFFP